MNKTSLEKAYAGCRRILAHTGHQIFIVRKKHYRLGDPIIAVRPDERVRSVIFIRKFHGRVHVAYAQTNPGSMYDEEAVKEMVEKFGKLIFRRPNEFASLREDNWFEARDFIVPEQYEEFDILINDARLS